MSKKQVLINFAFLVIFSQIIAGFYASYKIASILHFQPALFGSLADWGYPHLYQPFSWFRWYLAYGKEAPWIFNRFGFGICSIGLMFSVLISCIMFARLQKPKKTTHGSAHFATEEEIIEYSYDPDGRTAWEKFLVFFHPTKWFKDNRHRNDNDLFSGEGVFLGCLDNGKYIRDNSKTHVLICAPTRSGKGVGHIVPTLLAWGGSVIVTDIKGENWELTSGYRKTMLGNDVFMFKPTSRDSCHYNPLDEIRIGTPYEMNDLQLITKILVDPTGKGGDGNNAHWVNNAWDLLQGVVLHLLYAKRFHNGKEPGRTANLSDVLDFLYDGQGSEGKESAEKLKKLEEKHALEKKFNEQYNQIDTFTVPTAKQVVANMSSDENNDAEEDTASASSENAIVFKVYSAERQYQNSIAVNDNLFLDDFFDSPDDDYDDGKELSFEEIRASMDKKSPANPEENWNVKSDTGSNEKYADSMDMSKADEPLDVESFKEAISSQESETLSGLQKKFDIYIKNYDGDGHGYCHAPDDDKEMFLRLYPDKVNRDGLHPHVRQLFQSMVDKPDKEFGSILSTLNTALILYRNPIIVDNIRDSDFVMKDLMDCKKPISLYLVFGPGEMDVVRPLLRVVVDMLWRLNVEEMKFSDGKAVAHKHRLLLLLDEFPALGKMDGFAISEGFIAGYGMKACIITQDLNQINNIYGKDNYVVSNCQVQVYHTPSDNNSAKYLSDKLGNETIESTSSSRNSVLLPMPNSYSDSYISRPLMYPNEVSTLDPAKLLVFCKGLSPILCNKIRYFEDPVFLPRTKILPPVFSDIVSPSDRCWDISDYHSLMDAKKAYEAKQAQQV